LALLFPFCVALLLIIVIIGLSCNPGRFGHVFLISTPTNFHITSIAAIFISSAIVAIHALCISIKATD